MLRRPFQLLLLLALSSLVLVARGAEEQEWVIESKDGIRYELGTGRLLLTNAVTVRLGIATLVADRAELNRETGECVAEGHVQVQDGRRIWSGARASYNFLTGHLTAEAFRAGQAPAFVEAARAAGEQKDGVYVLADGLFTTDDHAEPNHYVHAERVVVVAGEYVECRNAKVYLGSVPVFWWPVFRIPLQRTPNRWTATPGYRSKYGPYLLTAYEFYWNERLSGAMHFDERLRRGPGVGPDLSYRLPEFGEGTFKYYYTYDQRPGEDDRGEDIDNHRQRVWFEHQARLATNATLKAMVRYQSDSRMVRDFFLSEYRDDSQPSTFLEFEQSWANWTLNGLYQPRVNQFQETVERLPDIKLTALRQQIGPTPFYYESDSSFAYLQREYAYNLTNRYEAARADTFHQVQLPWTFFNWLNVTPKAGGRLTWYGEADGPGATTGEEARAVFNTGAEVTTKFWRTWDHATNGLFQIDGLRHVVQPSLNYVWVPDPGTPVQDLPQFDYEVPSTRLLPINFFDYNSIDSIDSQNVVRVGLDQRLQTRRRGALENVARWAVYTDWRIDPNEQQDTFSDLYSDLDLRPFHWLAISSQVALDLDNGRFDSLAHWATFTPNDVWSWRVGQNYLRDGAFFGDGTDGYSLLSQTLYLRLNQNWGLRMSHYYNIRDHLFQHQYYTVYRDFRSFTLSMTAGVQQDVGGETDYGVAISVSSKAFPRYGLGSDVNKPTRLLGY
jgi:lipopolysaccharide assembly outer membrane protein LptD (OstA)